jgi:tetratricopeptide (TPR) repeat protein
MTHSRLIGPDSTFKLQDSISARVTEVLALKLSAEEQRMLAWDQTTDAEAYQLYLKGRYFWNRRTQMDLRKAIELFDGAIALDPSYALAYAGLGDSYQVLAFHGGLSPNEYFPKARAAAERAIEFDENLAEAHCTPAYVRFYYDWDWVGAEREFKGAIELNPDYATAHQWYGEYLGYMGRPDESLAEREQALNLDPLSPIITSELGLSYLAARKYDRALEEFRKAVELYPDFAPAHSFLAEACEWNGLYDEAISECRKAINKTNDNNLEVQLAQIYARCGRRADALRLLAEMKVESNNAYYPATQVAVVYEALGDKEQALDWLETAYEVGLKVYPMYDSLRSEPRFVELMKRMGLSY